MEKIRNIFTAENLKKAGGCLGVCAVIASSATWYHHQHKQVVHAQVRDAQNKLIEAQAAQHDLTLLNTDTVRTLTADAIGSDETTVNYRDITLIDPSQHIGIKNKDKHKGEKHKAAYKHNDDQDKTSDEDTVPSQLVNINSSATTADYAAITAPQAADVPANLSFRPIYRVACKANNVKYNLRIDAVTGQVLKCNIE